MQPLTDFASLCKKYRTQEKKGLLEGALLSLDPGGTTGVAIFQNMDLVTIEELTGEVPEQGAAIVELITRSEPQFIVCEDYRIYKWKAKDHTWSDLHTPRLIGVIEFLAHTHEIPLVKQPAHVAKQFCTDEKLRKWNYHDMSKGQRHARDAIRHGCYFLMFGKEPQHEPD